MILSIIIPVFNVEDYVAACLDSVYEGISDLSSFEVIVVNDGSKDGSVRIVERYGERFSNLFLIEQQNQGLSAARMNGLAHAQGEYVWFVDSDDWVEPNAVERVLRLIREKEGFPVFITPIRKYDIGLESFVDDYQNDCPQTKDGWELLKLFFPVWFAQRFIVRKDLFDNPWLRFPKGLLHEDEYFGPVLLALAGPCYVDNTPLYDYRLRPGSISNSISAQSSYDFVSIYKQLKAFAETLPKPYRKQFIIYCQRYPSRCYKINRDNWDTPEFRHFMHKHRPYLFFELFRYARYYSFKNWIATLIQIVSPTFFQRLFPAKKPS